MKRDKSTLGFSMVELMFSMVILGIAMTSILGTFMAFAKSSVSLSEYVEMSHESRMALEIFSRDIRGANGLTVVNPKSSNAVVYSEQGIDLTYPSYYGDRRVSYRYDSRNQLLRRSEVSNGTTVRTDSLSGMREFKLQFFQTPGTNLQATSGPVASVNSWTKSLQLDAELVRTVMTLDNTDYIISARFMMRNM